MTLEYQRKYNNRVERTITCVICGMVFSTYYRHKKTISKEELNKRLNLFDGCCYCGSQHNKLTVEHLVPISKGGTDIVLNLFGACSRCNSSKGNKHFLEWYRKQSFYNSNKEYKILQNTLAG